MDEKDIGFKVCPHCYSTDLEEMTLVGGPMAHLDNDDGSFKCFNCGKIGVPMEFATVDEYQSFVLERGASSLESGPEFVLVPLLPLETGGRRSMRMSGGTSRPVTRVTEVIWELGSFQTTGRKALLGPYWQKITKEVYGSKEAAFLDLDGINEGEADIEGMRRAMKRKNQIWLDIGLRGEQDVFDAFLMGADHMLVCTIGTSSLEHFRKAIDLSDRVVPCICCAPDVVWRRQREPETDPRRVADALRSMGYRRIAFLDLRRIGRGQGPDRYWAGNMCTYAEAPLIGGGVGLADRELLLGMGAGGALLDPFGPEVVSKMDG